jgi:hypothetical protein
VKARAVAVHAVEVLDYRVGIGQIAAAVWATVAKRLPDKARVFFAVNPDRPTLRGFSAQFVKKHANELIRHVGLGASRGRA